MNKIYRLKLNDEQRLVVVSELATRASSIKGSKSKHQQKSSVGGFLHAASLGLKTLPLLLATFSLLGGVGLARAHSNPTVISGNASFNTNGNITTIHNSPNTIINWQDFNISKREVVEFIQENSSSAVLNRVLGGQVTKILGELRSNGKVFVVNPAGIVFGKNANINVQSLVASTLDINNNDFISGKYRFTTNGRAAALATVVNQGLIKVGKNGKVALLGGQVINEGIIKAQDGEVLLLAGKSIELSDLSNPRITYRLTAGNKAINIGDIISGKTTMLAEEVVNAGSISATSAKVGADGGIYLFADEGEKALPSPQKAKKAQKADTAKPQQSQQSQQPKNHQKTNPGRVTNKGSLLGKKVVVKGKEVHLTKGSTLVAQAQGSEKATVVVGEGSLLPQSTDASKKAEIKQQKTLHKTLAFDPALTIKEALANSTVDSTNIHTDKLLVEDGATIIARRQNKFTAEGLGKDNKEPSTPSQVNQIFLAAKESFFGGSYNADQGIVETSGKRLSFSKDFTVNTKGGTWLMDPYDIFITKDPAETFVIEKGTVIDDNSHFFTTSPSEHYYTYDSGSASNNSTLLYSGDEQRVPRSDDEYYYAEVSDSFIEKQLENNHVVIFTKEGNIGGEDFSITSRNGKNLSLLTRAGALRFSNAHFILTNRSGSGVLNLAARDGIYLSNTAIDASKVRLYAQGSIVINSYSVIKGILDLKATNAALSINSNFWTDSGLSNDLAANNAPSTLWRRNSDYAVVIEESELINKGQEFSTLYTDKKAYFDNITFTGDSTYTETETSASGPVITNRTKKSSEEIKELLRTKEAGFVRINAKGLQFANGVNVAGTYVKATTNKEANNGLGLGFVKGTVFNNTENGFLSVNVQGVGTLTSILSGTGANDYIKKAYDYPLNKDQVTLGTVSRPTIIERPAVANNNNPLGVTFQGTNFNFYFKELKTTPERENNFNKIYGDLGSLKLAFKGATVNFNLIDEAVNQGGAQFSSLTLGSLELDNSTVKFNGDNLSGVKAVSTVDLSNNSNLTIFANRLSLNDALNPEASSTTSDDLDYTLSNDSVLNLGGYRNRITHIAFNRGHQGGAATVGKVNLLNYPNGSIVANNDPQSPDSLDVNKNQFTFFNTQGINRITADNLDNAEINFYNNYLSDSVVNLVSDKAQVTFSESKFINSELFLAANNLTVKGLENTAAADLRRGPNRAFDHFDLSLVHSNFLITNDISNRRASALTASEQLLYPAKPEATLNLGGITIQNEDKDSTVSAFGRNLTASDIYFQGRALNLSAAQVNLQGSWYAQTAVNADEAVILPGIKTHEDYKEGLYVHGQDIVSSATIETNNTLDLHGSKSLRLTVGSSLKAKDIYLGDYRGNASYQTGNETDNQTNNQAGNQTNSTTPANVPSLAKSALYTIEVEGNIEASQATTFRNSLKVKNVKLDATNFKLAQGSALTLDNANFTSSENLDLTEVQLTKNSRLKANNINADNITSDNSLIYSKQLNASTIEANNNSAYSIEDTVSAAKLSLTSSSLSSLNVSVTDKLLAQENSNIIAHDTVSAKNALFLKSQLTTEDYQGEKLTATNSRITANDESQVDTLSLDHANFLGKTGTISVSNKLSATNNSLFESQVASLREVELTDTKVNAINVEVSGNLTAQQVDFKANKLVVEPKVLDNNSNPPKVAEVRVNFANSSVKTLDTNKVKAEELTFANTSLVSPKVDWEVTTLNVDKESSIVTDDFKVRAKNFNVEDLHSIHAKKVKLFCNNSATLNCNDVDGRDSLFDNEEEEVLDVDLSDLLGFNLSTVFSAPDNKDEGSKDNKDDKKDDKNDQDDAKDKAEKDAENAELLANLGLDKTPEQRAEEKKAKREARRAKRRQLLQAERKALDKSAEAEERRLNSHKDNLPNQGSANSASGGINSSNTNGEVNANNNQDSSANSNSNSAKGTNNPNGANSANNANSVNGGLNNGDNSPVSRGDILNAVNGITNDAITKENLTSNQVKQALDNSGFKASEVSQSTLNAVKSQGVSSSALPYGNSDRAFSTIAKVDVSSYFGVNKLDDQVNDLQSSAYRKPLEVVGKVNKMVNDLSSLPEKITKGKEINFNDRSLQVLVESSSQKDLSILNRAKKSPGKIFGVYGNIVCRESKVKGITAFCKVIDDKKPTGLTLPQKSK